MFVLDPHQQGGSEPTAFALLNCDGKQVSLKRGIMMGLVDELYDIPKVVATPNRTNLPIPYG